MVKVVNMDEFFSNTMGGRPCQLDTSIYSGLDYECGCGSTHRWSPSAMPVIREIPVLRIVIDNPSCGFVTLVKIKGIFSYKLQSELSAKNG
tara:strand:- start:351 stop:623 length:273 start_codon:yes stop_codon:yes gene_type:complete